MVVVLNITVVRRGVLIGSITKLGNELNGVLGIRNLNQSSTLLVAITIVVGTLQMVTTTKIGFSSLI